MTDEQETALINRVVSQVAEANKPKGWAKVAMIATPVLGVLWSVVAVAFVPWVTWVTMSVIRLEPDKPRVVPTDYLMADSAVRDQLRAELKLAFDDLSEKLDRSTDKLSGDLKLNTELLGGIKVQLARKGIE